MGVGGRIPLALDALPGGKSMVNAVDVVVNWARANSLWPLTYGTACCAIEMMSASMPRYDISRFGSEVFRATPRQADLIILAGTIVEKMVLPLQTLYAQLPAPKYVLAMGACTISGGPFFYDNYSVVKGADRIIPVDVFVPGCPPRPEALFYGLLQLQELIKKNTIRHPWHPRPLNIATIESPHAVAKAQWDEQEKAKDIEQAEARKAFKEANPGYKAVRTPKVESPAYPEVPRPPARGFGLPNARILELIRARFPEIALQGATPDSTPSPAEGAILDFVVPPAQYRDFVAFAKGHPELAMNVLSDLTAIDFRDRYELLAYLRAFPQGHGFFVRVPLPKRPLSPEEAARPICPDASAPSLCDIYPAANWHEREIFDLMGIAFEGHPDLRRIFLDDTFAGHPLRKDYSNPNMLKRPY